MRPSTHLPAAVRSQHVIDAVALSAEVMQQLSSPDPPDKQQLAGSCERFMQHVQASKRARHRRRWTERGTG